MDTVTALFFLITISLIQNTVKDIKSKKVDSRINNFALGATLLFFLTLKLTLLQTLIILVTYFALLFLFKKSNAFADGDIEALSFIFLALIPFGYKLIIFLISLSLLYLMTAYLKKLMKIEGSVAGYPILLGAWIIAIFS